MAIPDFQSILKPLLDYAAGQKHVVMNTAIEAMGAHFKLTVEELGKKNAGGTPTFRRYIAFDVLRDRIKQADAFIKFLKPEFLKELSEACELDND